MMRNWSRGIRLGSGDKEHGWEQRKGYGDERCESGLGRVILARSWRVAMCASALVFVLGASIAHASDFVMPKGGKLTIELLGSDAAFSNTLSLIPPPGAPWAIAVTGCNPETADQLTGLKLVSEKAAVRGCRAVLDADVNTPGIQPFPAGTTLHFNMCAKVQDPGTTCDFIWSSDPSQNSDKADHVRTNTVGDHTQLSWEDEEATQSDNDFNDLMVNVWIDGDRDGDGLWDDWETSGIDVDGDGHTDLNLPALGADPDHKDLFVQVDYMDCKVPGSDCAPGDTHSHQPKAEAMDAVKQFFASAPVHNVNGSPDGITLHVFSNAIAHQDVVHMSDQCVPADANGPRFDAIKVAHFGPSDPRHFAFRYALWAHRQAALSTVSGCGEFPGDDLMVSLGGWAVGTPDEDVGTVQQQAGTFIHELGHTLNLDHGGGDGVDFKPNYLSLMNHFFQMSGIPGGPPPPPLNGQLLFSTGTLGPLDEHNLNENATLDLGTSLSSYFCPDGTVRPLFSNFPIDWNCDNSSNGTVAANINFDGGLSTLVDFNDWGHLQYSFQETGAYEQGVHTSRANTIEIDYPTFVRDILADLVLEILGPPQATAGTQVTYTLTARNLHPDQAGQVLVEDALPAGLSFVSCLATSGGTCGGSGADRTISFAGVSGGGTVSASLTTQLSCALPDGATITNQAIVSALTGDSNASNNDAVTQLVVQNPAPVLSAATPSQATLSPPNHKLVDVTINYDVTDNCVGTTCSLSVSSSEPVNGTGDGDTAPDWIVVDAHHVQLRAERASGGPGRTYSIGVTCTDSGGAVSTTSTTVRVPHDRQ